MRYNNYFVFDGKPSTEFGLIISGSSTWGSSEFDIGTEKVPGRNGDILSAHGRYKNFPMEYSNSAITRNFHTLFPELRAFLLSHTNKYYKLEDTYHEDDKIPFIVGGTGHYIRALIYDYDFHDEDDEDKGALMNLDYLIK